jgi:hypothetical protein
MLSDDSGSGNNEGRLFTRHEQEAVDFFREYPDIICNTLRYPTQLEKEDEWSSFLAFLKNLDSALCKSSLGRNRLLFHGVRSEFVERLLFLLDIPADPERRTTADFTPHVIQDPSYVMFTSRASAAIDRSAKSGSRQVFFVYEGVPADSALPMDKNYDEILFPRNSRWLTTGHSRTGSGITCIALEKFA